MTQRLASWVQSANSAETEFPLNNLPYGVFSAGDKKAHCGIAIGDFILDVTELEAEGAFELSANLIFSQGRWNDFMALGKPLWQRFRQEVINMLAKGSSWEAQLSDRLIPQSEAHMHMPFTVTEFTDFYAGRHHATNVGTMFRGAENALPPNWLHIPIGYNGRASSVILTGSDVMRPYGQVKAPDDDRPHFAPSARFDFELELGAIVGTPSQGRISVDEADENIFGYVLLNDWSARDIQAWEYQPLGPFQAKATATTISAWIVTSQALAPFRVPTPPREFALLDHLKDTKPMLYDIALNVRLETKQGASTIISQTNYKEIYYSSAQQLAHHTSSGCPMRVGDLLGSGTISGANRDNCGSMLEISWGGSEPLTLDNGEQRRFLEDHDKVRFTGAAIAADFKVGFGVCEGRIIPAKP